MKPLLAARQAIAPMRLRGHSSAGRALAWHARGQRFDPAWLHQFPRCNDPPNVTRSEATANNRRDRLGCSMLLPACSLAAVPARTVVVASRLIVVAASRAACTARAPVALEQLLIALAHRAASTRVGPGMLEFGAFGDASG